MRTSLALVVLFTAGAFAADGDLQFAALADFRLESGETLRNCRIGYRTFGKLDGKRANAVLFPTWFTGASKDLAGNIGPGKMVDPSRYFVIAVDALGNGVSSSPSNSDAQPRMRFPKFTIRDMVKSQHELLTRVLGISHLRAVMGISMGGMQTFQWIISYPDFMDKAVPVVGTPRLTSYDLLLWNAEKHAIESDRNWNGGNYERPPEAGMRTVAAIHALQLSTPRHRNSETSVRDFPEYLAKTERDTISGFDANNWLRQLEAMIAHDVMPGATLEQAAKAVKARVLVVVGTQDLMVNPQPALEFAKLLGARTVELAGDCGHLSPGCEEGKANPAIAEFLAQ